MNACKKTAARLVAGISLVGQVLGLVVAFSLMDLCLAAARDRGDRGRDLGNRGDDHTYRGHHHHDDDDDDGGDKRILAIQHAVPHMSTVPAIAGERVELFAWERVRASKLKKFRKKPPTGKVVLFIHGATVPSVPAFDLDYKDYSWMESLARAGVDVFSLDRTGYGFSPRPQMDDPCNVNPAQQSILIPHPLAAPCPHSYPFRLTHTASDTDDIGAAVDYIRALRRVDRITIAGWSGVGPQVGPYAVKNQDKIDRLIFYAPNYERTSATNPPAELPQAGFPMNLRTRLLLEAEWDSQVACEGQFEPAIRDVVWRRIMDFEPVGRTWGPLEGVMRARTITPWGWNQTVAPTIKVPMLIIVGQNDTLLGNARDLYQDLGAEDKVLVEVPCASHFLVWETNHKILHTASKKWLRHGSLKGVRQGVFTLDADGRLTLVP
jgi:pimeloyl-ACP methyl ester carboxylesterase